VLDASNELSPSQAQSQKRIARAVRRGKIRELEEQQQAHLDRVQASVSESDISASENPTVQYARIDRREDAVFDVLSMLPFDIQAQICDLVYDPWEDFE
jgi:hypothetical protein